MKEKVFNRGKLHGFTGIDFFVFLRNTIDPLPSFAAGEPGWDNFLIYRSIKQRMLVVDTTDACLTIHQNHDYSHLQQGNIEYHKGDEALGSWKKAGDGALMLDRRDVKYQLQSDGSIISVSNDKNIVRKVAVRLMLNKNFTYPIRIIRYINKFLRRLIHN